MKDSKKKVDKIDKEMGEYNKDMTVLTQRFERQDSLITELIHRQYINQNRNDTSMYNDVNWLIKETKWIKKENLNKLNEKKT